MFNDNKLLGSFNLEGIPPASRGVPQIEVSFDIDANGIVHVGAKDLATKKEQSIRITSSHKLDEEEVRRMQKDAESHAEEDKKRMEKVTTLNEAEQMVFQYEHALKEMGDKVDQSQLGSLKQDIEGLKELLKDKENNYETIKTAKDALTEKFSKVSEEMYKKAAEEHAKQNPGAGGAAHTHGERSHEEGSHDKHPKKGKEKVVDAEFKEKGKK